MEREQEPHAAMTLEPTEPAYTPRDGRPHFGVVEPRIGPTGAALSASGVDVRGRDPERDFRLRLGTVNAGAAVNGDTPPEVAARGAVVQGNLGIGPEGRRNVDVDIGVGTGFVGIERREGVTRVGAEANVAEVSGRLGGNLPGLGYTAIGGSLRYGIGGSVERACIPQSEGRSPIVGAGIEGEFGVGFGANFRSERLGYLAQHSRLARRFFNCPESVRAPEAKPETEGLAPQPGYHGPRRDSLTRGLAAAGAYER